LQSPINIDTSNAKDDSIVGPIKFLYESINNSTLTNDGRHLQVTLTRNESGTIWPKSHLLLLLHHQALLKRKNNNYNEYNISWQHFDIERVTKDTKDIKIAYAVSRTKFNHYV